MKYVATDEEEAIKQGSYMNIIVGTILSSVMREK